MSLNRWFFLGIFLIVIAPVFARGQKEQSNEVLPYEFCIAHPGHKGENQTLILDPHLIENPAVLRIWDAISEGLVVRDPLTGEGIPGLAESWDISSDGRFYTFHMRDSVWQDGTPVTAEQTALSWKRLLDPELDSPHAWYLAMFIEGATGYLEQRIPWEEVGIKVLDDKTLRIELSGPYPFFINAMAHQSFAVLPIHLLDGNGEDWAAPGKIVGNGAYSVKLPINSNSNQIVLQKRTDFHRAGLDMPDRIILKEYGSSGEALEAYRAGELDWVPADQLTVADLDNIKYEKDFLTSPLQASYFYVFNTAMTPLKDRRIRQAMNLAIDREVLIDTVLRGCQIPAYSPVPEMSFFSPLQPEESLQDLRCQNAVELLKLAGFQEGKGIPALSMIYLESEGHRAVAEFLRDQWQDVLGITVTLSGRDSLSYYNDRKNGSFAISLGGWQGVYPDPMAFLYLFLTGEPVFGGTYSDPEYDRLLVDAALERDQEKRFEILRKAERLLCLDDAALLPLFYYRAPQLIDLKKWRGFSPNPLNIHPLWNLTKRDGPL